MQELEEHLRKIPFWKDLPEEEKETLRCSAFLRRYPKGSLIHGGQNECLGMLLLLQGEVRTYLLSEEGREITLFRLYAGDSCVLSASCVISQITFETHMTAAKNTTLLIVPSGVIAALSERELAVRCFFYEQATARFSDVMWSMQQILFRGLDRRLAAFLVQEAERTGASVIRMTHEEVAKHISSAREAVARMLKQFSEEGLVELKRGAIFLRDPAGLNTIASP